MKTYYLAYGMNTNLDGMATRCPQAESLGKVTVPGHKLAFKTFCDAVVSPKDSMECALWLITEQCEKNLDALEGFPDFYGKKEVEVEFKGKPIRAMIYYMTDHYGFGAPSEGYLNMVVEGYHSHNMPIMQIVQALEDITVCTS